MSLPQAAARRHVNSRGRQPTVGSDKQREPRSGVTIRDVRLVAAQCFAATRLHYPYGTVPWAFAHGYSRWGRYAAGEQIGAVDGLAHSAVLGERIGKGAGCGLCDVLCSLAASCLRVTPDTLDHTSHPLRPADARILRGTWCACGVPPGF